MKRGVLRVTIAAAGSMLVFAGGAAAAQVRAHGLIRDAETGKPVADVEVVVVGTDRTFVSDGGGRFTISRVTDSRVELRLSRIGYAPQQGTVELPEGRVMDLDIRLTPKAVELEALTVEVTPRSPWLDSQGFYDRRLYSGLNGHFITRDVIERRNPRGITDLLDNVPGVNVLYIGPGQRTLRFNRPGGGVSSEPGQQRRGVLDPRRRAIDLRGCEPDLYIDGARYRSGRITDPNLASKVDDYDVLPVTQIDAAEVYLGANTPVQYKNACGVILLWTRRG
jgi:hypothetical protein